MGLWSRAASTSDSFAVEDGRIAVRAAVLSEHPKCSDLRCIEESDIAVLKRRGSYDCCLLQMKFVKGSWLGTLV
jgi:hypothetical protein